LLVKNYEYYRQAVAKTYQETIEDYGGLVSHHNVVLDINPCVKLEHTGTGSVNFRRS
jgi:hypothetical protein